MYTTDNLTKLKKMDALAPEAMKAFWAFDKAAVAEGTIPVKYKWDPLESTCRHASLSIL